MPDASDRRAKLIVLTVLGYKALQDAFDTIIGIEADLEVLLLCDGLVQFRRVLTQVAVLPTGCRHRSGGDRPTCWRMGMAAADACRRTNGGVELSAEHEVGHKVLDGLNHVSAVGGLAAGHLGRRKEGGHVVSGDDVADEHGRPEQGAVDWQRIVVVHAHGRGVEDQVEAGGISGPGRRAAFADASEQPEEGGDP